MRTVWARRRGTREHGRGCPFGRRRRRCGAASASHRSDGPERRALSSMLTSPGLATTNGRGSAPKAKVVPEADRSKTSADNESHSGNALGNSPGWRAPTCAATGGGCHPAHGRWHPFGERAGGRRRLRRGAPAAVSPGRSGDLRRRHKPPRRQKVGRRQRISDARSTRTNVRRKQAVSLEIRR